MADGSRPCPCGVGDRFDYETCGQEAQVEHVRAVICPDFFAGREAWKLSDDWSKFDDFLETRDAWKINKEADAVLKYLKEQCGAKKLGFAGFCWGGIAVHHLMMTYLELKAGVSLYGHPAGAEAKEKL